MKLSAYKFLHRFTLVNLELIRTGGIADFYRMLFTKSSSTKGQETILKLGDKLLGKFEKGSAIHLLVLEDVSEAYMRKHCYEQAIIGFEEALDATAASSDITDQPRHLSYLTQSLAYCYFNIGNRQETIDIIAQAIRWGVPINNFSGLLDPDKMKYIEELIEQPNALNAETTASDS